MDQTFQLGLPFADGHGRSSLDALLTVEVAFRAGNKRPLNFKCTLPCLLNNNEKVKGCQLEESRRKRNMMGKTLLIQWRGAIA